MNIQNDNNHAANVDISMILTDKSRRKSRMTNNISLRRPLRAFKRTNSSKSICSTASACSTAFSIDESVVSAVSLKGCLKETSKSGSKKKRVRFPTFRSKERKVHKIEPLFQYAEDLWWSKGDYSCFKVRDELKKAQDGTDFKTYMELFIQARNEVEPAPAQDGKQAKPHKLSDSIYTLLVVARNRGFAGAEIHYTPHLRHRKQRVNEMVNMVVTAYRECQQMTDLSQNQRDSIVSKYAKSFTSRDRYWGSIMGKADTQSGENNYVLV